MSVDVSVVIVNWNSVDYLRSCLATLFARTRAAVVIVVIDSGSLDGCDRMLAEHYPQVKFIQSLDNLGFAKANNRAVDECTGEYVLFLNPDTELVGPAIDTLFRAMQGLPECGAAGGMLLNSDGSIQSSSIQAMPTILNKLLDFDFLKQRWPRAKLWGMAPLFQEMVEPREVEAISGAALMVKRRTLEQVGRFSEDYFMYAEDVDLCQKLRLAGYHNYYVPQARLIHHGGSSSKGSSSTFAAVMMPEATRRFLRKTRGNQYALCYRLSMCAAAVGRLSALALASVVYLRGSQNASVKAAQRKWLAVLRWSVGRDQLIKKYYLT